MIDTRANWHEQAMRNVFLEKWHKYDMLTRCKAG